MQLLKESERNQQELQIEMQEAMIARDDQEEKVLDDQEKLKKLTE